MRLAAPLILLAALTVSACESKPPATLANTESLYPIAVEPRAVYLKLPPASDGGLRWADAAETRAFVADWAASGHGPLRVAAASRNGEARLLAGVREAARDVGADSSRIRASNATNDPTTLLLAFEKLTAVPPVCDMDAATLQSEKNDRSSVLGCATRRNLAALVANPADLVAPATPTGGAFAQRRAMVIENWRRGKPTAAAAAESDTSALAFVSRMLGSGK